MGGLCKVNGGVLRNSCKVNGGVLQGKWWRMNAETHV